MDPIFSSSGPKGRPRNSRGRFGQTFGRQRNPSGALTELHRGKENKPSSKDKNPQCSSSNHQPELEHGHEVGAHTSKNNQPTASARIEHGGGGDDNNASDLSPASLKLRQLIEKYYQVGPQKMKFDTFPLEEAQDLLEATEMKISAGKTNGLVYCTHAQDGPKKFTLQWKSQGDRLKLISFVLIDRINCTDPDERIFKIDMNQYTRENFVGIMVAAPRGNSGDYARAKVLRWVNEESVLVHFMDFGNTDKIELDRLLNSPLEFLQIPPISFTACLADLDQEAELSESSKLKFQGFVNGGELDCSVQDYDDQSELWKVHLLKRTRSGTVDVTEHILRKGDEGIGAEKVTYNPLKTAPAIAELNPQQPQVQLHSEGRVGNLTSVKSVSVPQAPSAKTAPPVRRSTYGNFVSKGQHKPKFRQALSLKIDEPNIGSPGHGRKSKILRIVSPSEFYVEVIMGTSVNEREQFLLDLQKTYNYQQNVCSQFSAGTTVPGECFVWKDPESKKWHRVSIIQLVAPRLDVCLVDEGRNARCSIYDEFRELHGRFADHQAFASRFHLLDIKSPQQDWSEEAISFFRKWCDEAPTLESALMPDALKKLSFGFHKYSCGVMLAGKKNAGFESLGTAQAALCSKGLAVPLGILCGRHDLSYSSQEDIPNYRREELEKELGLTFETPLEKSLPKTREVFLLERPLQVHLGYLDISAVNGPGNFYIQMASKSPELKNMENDLRSVADGLDTLPTNEFSVGDIVLACTNNKNCLEEETKWFRAAIILTHLDERIAWSVSIDHGFELSIDLSVARKLPEYVSRIPPFCHRAHLDFPVADKIYTPTDSIWSEEADGMFRRYIESFKEGCPDYYGWEVRSGKENSIVKLDEFNQKIFYDHEAKQWLPGRRVKKRDYLSFSRLRNRPMLKHLFVSIGIDVKYETIHAYGRRIELTPAWDIFIGSEVLEEHVELAEESV